MIINDKIVQFSEVYNVKPVTTQEMTKAIDDWYNLYYAKNASKDEDTSMRLPVAIVSKISKAVFSEYEAESENEFAQQILKGLEKVRKKALQQTLIGGWAFLKPMIFKEGKTSFVVISRNSFIVLGQDEEDNVTDIGTIEETESNGVFYTLFERRTVKDDKLVIDSRLYASKTKEGLGNRVPLTTLAKYAEIEPINEIAIDNIGLIPIICPQENCIDGTDEPVSVYAAATGKIHNINVNEAQLNTEFENGKSRIMVSNDLLKRGKNGTRSLTDTVYVGMDDDPENIGINIFSPQLRDASYLARKTEYLRDIETLIGFKRGVLADVNDQERTATEVTSSAGEYNLTIIDFQEMWENALREAIRISAEVYKAYGQAPVEPKEEDVVVNWGNGILYDKDKTFAEYVSLVQAGMLKPEIAIAYYFNIEWKTAEDLAKIRADYMPEIESLLG